MAARVSKCRLDPTAFSNGKRNAYLLNVWTSENPRALFTSVFVMGWIPFRSSLHFPLIIVHGDTATSQVIFTEYRQEKVGDPMKMTTQGKEYATWVKVKSQWLYKTRQIASGSNRLEGVSAKETRGSTRHGFQDRSSRRVAVGLRRHEHLPMPGPRPVP